MTDNEIIKALECVSDKKLGDCNVCPLNDYDGDCAWIIVEHALDLINRQKAEIERLNNKHINLLSKIEHLTGV